MRVTSFTMIVVVVCVCALCATRFSGSGGGGTFAGVARTVLPWGMGLLFLLCALGGMLRGLRSIWNTSRTAFWCC
jgi:L-cystine uptake protein TcyP (sodium:dicarboxylate symporter family)